MRRCAHALVALAATSGCGRLSFDAQPDLDSDATVDARCAFGPWSPPTIVAELSTDNEESPGTLSRDGTTIFFASDRPGGAGALDLYMATRASTSDVFSAPVNLTALNSAADETSPALSEDQLSLYFATNRVGLFRLYVATRSSPADAFGAPSSVPVLVTGFGDVGGPEPSADELTLYFDATIGGPGGLDLWLTTRASRGDAWATPTQVSGVNTAGTEAEPAIDDGGLTLYYVSDMFETPPNDLVVATRSDTASSFGPPSKVPLALNPGVGEYGGDISADGTTMELSIHLGAPLVTNVWLATRSCL